MKLINNEVKLFVCWPEQITDMGLLKRYRTLLSKDELEQMGRFYFARHQHQYLVTRALIRSCLSAFCQVDPAEWIFSSNKFGKPEIVSPVVDLPIRFNLSHTDGLLVCGIIRDADIGVDVEDTDRSTRTGFQRLSGYFSADEAAELKRLPRDQQKLRFFDYWTLKESYIKARGGGLSIPLDQFGFQFKDDKLEGFSVNISLNDHAKNWQFRRFSVQDRYRIAVAVRSDSRNLKISTSKSVPLLSTEPISLDYL